MSRGITAIDEAREVHQKWLAAMRAGDFEAAWQQTDRIEGPRRARVGGNAQPGELRWDGSSFTGRRVLIRCLHGLGDTLQFLRFIPLLLKQASAVTLAIQPQLLPLFGASSEFGTVVNGWTDDSFPGHDVEIEIMELAYALRVTEQSLPAEVPYLDVREIVSRSRWVAPRHPGKPRVGLVWKSSGWDAKRSLPASALAALACDDIEYYSLQQEVSCAELESVPLLIQDLSCETREIVDAASAMLWLDLIITVDGMPAHLAGALGRPVWVLLRRDADWRWMDHRFDSPWYPSMRLFRQAREYDWVSVVRSVRTALASFLPLTLSRRVSCPVEFA